MLNKEEEEKEQTSGRNLNGSSFNKADKICLKESYEKDIVPGIKPSYT